MDEWLDLVSSNGRALSLYRGAEVDAVEDTNDFGHCEVYLASGQVLRVAASRKDVLAALAPPPPIDPPPAAPAAFMTGVPETKSVADEGAAAQTKD